MPEIIADLTWRGLLHQSTAPQALSEWLAGGVRTLYAGFDPTADSLHVGHLMPLLMLRRFQRAGHRPIALVGGATGMIGDPSGKSEERNLLSPETLAANVAAIETQMRAFLDFAPSSASSGAPSSTRPGAADRGALLLNNFDWMRDYTYLAFLRDVGKNFPVNVMLAKDSVKSRLERSDAGLSYTEFSYMLLQAYDFVRLYDLHHCELQVGGSDQWGNITAGIDLGRRMRQVQLYGLTCQLLTTSEGVKMGKTEKGALWLSPDRTSPYAFFQYWLNVADADAGKCLRFLTDLTHAQIEELDRAREQAPHERASQQRLAEEMTRMVHGDAGLSAARRATNVFFGGEEIVNFTDAQLSDIFADVPSQTLPQTRLQSEGLKLIDALVEAGLAKSKGEARRVVEQGGAYVNNRRVGDVEAALTSKDLASESVLVLRAGKKKYALLRFA